LDAYLFVSFLLPGLHWQGSRIVRRIRHTAETPNCSDPQI
jgi:hypothetical protein